MKLVFDINSIVAAEQSLGKSLNEMLEEMQAERGASLRTLRALVAAGIMGAHTHRLPKARIDMSRHFYREDAAAEAIEVEGIENTVMAVSAALRTFLDRVGGPA